MPTLIDGKAIADAVVLDGLPRVAEADDGSRHVLYLDAGPLPRSMLAADWPGPLPKEPTEAERMAALQDRKAKKEAAKTCRAAHIQKAQSAVGVHVGQLTAPQLRALMENVLLLLGALDDDLQVRPLGEWVG